MSASAQQPPLGKDTSRAMSVAALCLGTLAVQFDSAVNVAFPDLVHAFALPIADIQWIVIAYTLTYAALMLVFGRTGDIFGHRLVFLLGAAGSALAFALCMLSTSYGTLLAARVLQGVGAALVLSCGPALLTGLYSETHRPRLLGLYTLLIGLGGAAGPIVGGLLVERWGWPAVFAFRLPFALAALVAGFALPAAPSSPSRERFDAGGATLLVLAISSALLGLNQLQPSGNTAMGILLLGVSGLLCTAFAWHEARTKQPVIDVTLFRDPDFALLNVAHALLNLAGFALLLLAPFYLVAIGGLAASAAGMVLSASPVGVIGAAPLANRLASSLHPRRMALLGALLSACSLTVISMLGSPSVHALGLQATLPVLILAAFAQGLGVGLFQVAYFDIATASLPKQNRGVAGSLVLMTRTLGLVIGANLLMLAFSAFSGIANGDPDDTPALLLGFKGAFTLAALISFTVVALALLRGWMRTVRPDRAAA
jgi:MFS family permease